MTAMSENRFTEAPWHVDKELGAPSNEWLIAYGDGSRGRGLPIARTATGTGKALANAHLIAQAPSMFAELQEAREWLFELLQIKRAESGSFAGEKVQRLTSHIRRIDVVLAKASGEKNES